MGIKAKHSLELVVATSWKVIQVPFWDNFEARFDLYPFFRIFIINLSDHESPYSEYIFWQSIKKFFCLQIYDLQI